MPSTRMLMDSRERAKPASSMTNPTCIQNTRNAASSTHTVLIALISGDGAPACACSTGGRNTHITASSRLRPMILPPTSASTFARMCGSRKLSRHRARRFPNCMFQLLSLFVDATHSGPSRLRPGSV